jgi:hypothetical protein
VIAAIALNIALSFHMMKMKVQSLNPPTRFTGSHRPSLTSTDDSLDQEQKGTIESRIREILRYTIMAPSSHNTQCWRFRIDTENCCVTILPDFDRACPQVDPDDHHLYATLGCAVENFVHAALASGFETKIDREHFQENPKEGIRLELVPCEPVASDLYEAIPRRQVTRCVYDGTFLSSSELEQLQEAGSDPERGISMIIIPAQETDKIQKIQELILEANTMQLTNPQWKQELASWVRFNEKECAEKGDGLAGKCTGNPSAPRWIGNLILNHVVSAKSENTKIVKQLQSSAGVAIFVSERDDPSHWMEVGRCYERFALQATALGIQNAFLNQPVEEASVRSRLAKELGLDPSARPDLLIRFGRGPEMPFSPRRPLESVIIEE